MRFFLFLIALLIATTGAHAAQCYTNAEVEAEQGLRIHSELMVISLNCQHMSSNRGNLYVQYKDFTRKHTGLIGQYEETMKSFYARNGSADAEKDINDLRTILANKISTDAARMKPNVFCKYYADRINQALDMDQAKLRRWASTTFVSHPVSRPMCIIN